MNAAFSGLVHCDPKFWIPEFQIREEDLDGLSESQPRATDLRELRIHDFVHFSIANARRSEKCMQAGAVVASESV